MVYESLQTLFGLLFLSYYITYETHDKMEFIAEDDVDERHVQIQWEGAEWEVFDGKVSDRFAGFVDYSSSSSRQAAVVALVDKFRIGQNQGKLTFLQYAIIARVI